MASHLRFRTGPLLPLLAFVFFFSTILLLWIKPESSFPIRNGSTDDERTKPRLHKCHAPKKNVWRELGSDEFKDVLGFVTENWEKAGFRKKGHVAFIENLTPNKSDILNFLDGESKVVDRWARVVIKNTGKEAEISEYMVGPIPTNNGTKILPLSYCYNSGRNTVTNAVPEMDEVLGWFDEVVIGPMRDLIEDLLGEVINPGKLSSVPLLMALSRPATFFEDGRVRSWMAVHSPGQRFDAWSLLPQGMYCRFDITGHDPSKWNINEWYYNGILYESSETFHKAWERGEVEKSPLNVDGHWTAAEPEKEGIKDRQMTAPVMVQPGGPRVSVDEEEMFVKWMGYEFYLGFSQVNSLSLWDVKFREERVLYELGLQEAMAHYAGISPMSTGMVWLDTLFGFGYNAYELVPGYDCPSYATYLSTSFHRGTTTYKRNNSICIFEAASDHPLHRHTTQTHVTISRNSYLVVRSVSTVGNYDYTLDYIFYLDGAMEVKVRASGYIFGEYLALDAARKEAHQDLVKRGEVPLYEYGYRIHDTVASSMHDHQLNFKADFDIDGTSNTLYRVEVAPMTRQYPWDDSPRNTMHLIRKPITTETGLDWPTNSGAMYVVLNNESTNIWGEKRGYRITPGTGMGTPPHLTMQNSSALGKAAGWANHNLWVLKRKDEEKRSASEWNAMEPLDPLIDFEKMVDGEDVIQDDLVLYFNLGVHHVPHSGDIPNTLMHWSGTSVMLIPHNFHDRDASRDSAHGVKLKLRGPGKGSDVEYFGGVYDKGEYLTKEDLEPNLSDYSAPDGGLFDLSWNSTLAAL